MTVAELIERLKGMPQDSVVVVPGYEGGFDDFDANEIGAHTMTFCKDVAWYYGKYDAPGARLYEQADKVEVVVLGSANGG